MIVHDSAISICYAMLCYAAVATVAAAVAVAGCNERERDMAAVRCEHVRL
jgi:hypothetical protein